MKRLSVSITALIAALLFLSCGKEEGAKPMVKAINTTGETTWYSFNAGYAKAIKEKKPMLVDFYADWCKWCRVMDKETFADPEVAAKLEKDFVAIRIHTDRPGGEKIKYKNHTLTAREFSLFLGVRGLPSLVFFDATGQGITKLDGFRKKDDILPILGYIADRCYTKNVAFESYLKGNKACPR